MKIKQTKKIKQLVKNLNMNIYNELVESDRKMCREMLNISLPLRYRVSVQCTCGKVRKANTIEVHVQSDPHRIYMYEQSQVC